jgi:hypothetical protein
MHDSNRRVLREARALCTHDPHLSTAAAAAAGNGNSAQPASDLEARLLDQAAVQDVPAASGRPPGSPPALLARRDSRTLWRLVRRNVGEHAALMPIAMFCECTTNAQRTTQPQELSYHAACKCGARVSLQLRRIPPGASFPCRPLLSGVPARRGR